MTVEGKILAGARVHKRPTGSDVARIAGVSAATVSYVISGRRDVALPEATRQRVWAAAQELGYQPNAVASALSTGRTGLIGVWIDTLVTSYHANVVHQLETHLDIHSYRLVINLLRRMENGVPMRDGHDLLFTDGLIVHQNLAHVRGLFDVNGRMRLPVVYTGVGAMPSDRVDSVTVDLGVGTTEAMRHLLGQGRTRIAYLTGETEIAFHDLRHTVYETLLTAAGFSPEYIVTPQSSRRACRETMRRYVQENGSPDGLFCHNDEFAVGAYRGLRDLGIRVPEGIALVGCDGIEETEYGDCPLSTIVQPLAEMAEAAWQLLDRRMREPTAPLEHIVLPAHLVVRQSSSPF